MWILIYWDEGEGENKGALTIMSCTMPPLTLTTKLLMLNNIR